MGSFQFSVFVKSPEDGYATVLEEMGQASAVATIDEAIADPFDFLLEPAQLPIEIDRPGRRLGRHR